MILADFATKSGSLFSHHDLRPERSLRAAIARAFALEVAVSPLFGLGFLQVYDLRLGQDQAFLRSDLREAAERLLDLKLHRLRLGKGRAGRGSCWWRPNGAR